MLGRGWAWAHSALPAHSDSNGQSSLKELI